MKRRRRAQRWPLFLVLTAFLSCSGAAAQENYALLVGCTKYPHLPSERQLRGPANDVLLMQDILRRKFAFSADDQHIRVLSEAAGAGQLPSKANIKNGFEWLARQADASKAAGKECQIVVLLSGHGSRQVDSPKRPEDPEPDGWDEVFLARDATRMTASSASIPGGIVDDELAHWVTSIRRHGALVWLIMDSCYSGTGIRGNDEMVGRHVDPLELASAEVQAQIEALREAGTTETWQPSTPFELGEGDGGIVAMYASLPYEKAVECPLPPEGNNRIWHGMLTFAMAHAIEQSRSPMSYQELIYRVRDTYHGWDRGYPTPLVEGPSKDQQVLGREQWPGRSSTRLDRNGDTLAVNAGKLHGITQGCVLAIYPASDDAEPHQVAGYVQVLQATNDRCTVQAIEYNQLPANGELPHGSRAEVVWRGDFRLRVAVETEGELSEELVARIRTRTEELAKKKDSLFDAIENPQQAHWLIRVHDTGHVLLVPAEGWSGRSARKIDAEDSEFTARAGEQFDTWLTQQLQRIFRVRNLKRLASESLKEHTATWREKLDIRLEAFNWASGEPVKSDVNGFNFYEGDQIGLRVHNNSRSKVDVTVLFLDSEYGIDAVYPKTRFDNRFDPGESRIVYGMQINTKTVGLEHMLLIAVRSERDPPVDFVEFDQQRLELAIKMRGPARGVPGPIAQELRNLLEQASYGQGQRSGKSPLLIDQTCLRLLSWNTLAKAAAGEQQDQ